MIGGYNGKMLFVNLTSGELEEKELSNELAQNFLGGYGIGAKVLYEMMPAGADPLGPESVLGFVTGLMNGTKAFFGARYTLVHKSPVTGGWNDANSGGFFGPELKKAGYDAVFVSGIAEKPVYLWIKDGKAEIKDASHLWGMDTKETWAALQKETGDPRVRCVAIGPAGERVSLISCPINDNHRAAGRGGGGAVMGSKKLKAIAVRGTGNVPVANPERLTEINQKVTAAIKGSPVAAGFGTYGTGIGTAASALNGDSPIKNWGGVGVVDIGAEKAQKLAASTLDKHKVKKYSCSNCPLGCGAEYEVKTGRWPLAQTERPEYETAVAFGSLVLCDEEDALFKCNEICNRYGLDTISTGMTVAWAMECYTNGILTKKDLDGLDLKWGNGEAVVALTQKIADAEGCGATLGNGSAYAAKKLGKGAEYLQTASGIELPMHDPKLAPGMARTYQYDPTPGRHVKGGLGFAQMMGAPLGNKHDYRITGCFDAILTAGTEVGNCAGFCMFMAYSGAALGTQNEYIEAITGMSFKGQDNLVTGLRILTLRQAFNAREGLKPSDFTIAQRAVGRPQQIAGPNANITVDNERLARNFFAFVGWDAETGKPRLDALRKLGHLDEVINDCYGDAG